MFPKCRNNHSDLVTHMEGNKTIFGRLVIFAFISQTRKFMYPNIPQFYYLFQTEMSGPLLEDMTPPDSEAADSV